jgi:PKD repeat protein
VEAAFINAAAAGIINVCAAGNNGAGDDTVIYPAKWYTSCIAVAATDSSDIRASFSSTGPDVEISAPGVGIYSTYPRNRYVSMSGTSMACPHVAGVVALMIKASIADVRGTLVTTAKDLGAPGWDPQYGNGLVDAEAAVGGTTEPPIVPNNPPVADSQSVGTDEDTSVSIKLTASDPEGDSLTYHIVSGPSHGSLSGATPNVIYTPNINYYGSDSFSFKVNDGNSDSNPATVSIDIIAVSDPPVADAGLDQSAFVGETVIFNGTDSYDPDGNIVSYDWDFGDGTESNVETTTHVYTATGAYIVTLTVTDEVGLMGEDTTIITVQEVTEDKLMYAVLDENLMTLIGRTVGKKNVFVRAVALVQIMDADGPVEGATVFGSWSGATSDVDSGVTDSFGKILISSDEVKNAKSGTTFTFTVDDVVKSEWIYDNADPSASKDVP